MFLFYYEIQTSLGVCSEIRLPLDILRRDLTSPWCFVAKSDPLDGLWRDSTIRCSLMGNSKKKNQTKKISQIFTLSLRRMLEYIRRSRIQATIQIEGCYIFIFVN